MNVHATPTSCCYPPIHHACVLDWSKRKLTAYSIRKREASGIKPNMMNCYMRTWFLLLFCFSDIVHIDRYIGTSSGLWVGLSSWPATPSWLPQGLCTLATPRALHLDSFICLDIIGRRVMRHLGCPSACLPALLIDWHATCGRSAGTGIMALLHILYFALLSARILSLTRPVCLSASHHGVSSPRLPHRTAASLSLSLSLFLSFSLFLSLSRARAQKSVTRPL
jgi:hypothetical protein